MSFPETEHERTWTAVVGTVFLALVGGSLLFPDRVYGGFIWQYFWGPVYADAHSAACAVWDGGARTLLYSEAACRQAAGPVAYPGYTAVSEVGYALSLLATITGVLFLLRRLNVGSNIRFLYALFPYMLLGGALRVVEDANNALESTGSAPMSYPLNTLFISPLIYFTVFFVALAILVVVAIGSRRGLTETYDRPFAAAGAVLLAAALGYLGYLAMTTAQVEFHPLFTVLTVLGATAITAVIWWVVRQYAPRIASGTEFSGAVILWGHAIDGVSNMLGIDWGKELGLGYDLVPKHPANRLIIGFTESVLPESIAYYIGVSWSFLLVKVVAAVFVVSLFDREMFEENPRYTVLLLVAILSVGLGPGTRDMLRATFGV